VERMIKALALEMKVDPIELRMRSFIKPEQFPYETTTGWTYDSGNYAETMKVAMDIAGYEELRREQAERRERGELMGIGVAFFTEAVGAGPRKHMDILGARHERRRRSQGAPVRQAWSASARRRRARGTRRRSPRSSRRSWHPPEDVEVRHGDTDKSPYGLGTYGSRLRRSAAVAVVRGVRDWPA
jgi:carbon-monoxide dehydrogenase large subunit